MEAEQVRGSFRCGCVFENAVRLGGVGRAILVAGPRHPPHFYMCSDELR